MGDMDWNGWFFNLDEAQKEVLKQRKPILLQFHREPCSGCKKMYAVTYPHPDVHRELHEWFIPLRLDIKQDRKERSLFSAVWTPSFYVLDYKGKVYFSLPGFLEIEDFRVVMRLGLAEYYIPRGKYSEAKALLQDGLRQFPDNPRAATLLLRLGMIEYLKKWDNKIFRSYMQRIREEYPHSAEARMWPWMDE